MLIQIQTCWNMVGSEQILPWVGGPQVDSNHSSHTLLLVVIGRDRASGKDSASNQHHSPQQLHDRAVQVTFTTKSEKKLKTFLT